MRKTLLVSVIWLAAAGLAAAQLYDPSTDPSGQAHLNQNQSGDRNNQGRGNQHGHGQGHETPPPPPIPRCADLAVTALGFATSIPGQAPLGANEVILQYDVHNAGTSMYVAPSGASQALSLEYTTPGGVHQIATTPLPPRVGGATPAAATSVTLAVGQSWRGYMRVTLPLEARRWPLRLKLSFAQSNSPYAARISDCNPDHDQVVVPRSLLPPLPAQPAG